MKKILIYALGTPTNGVTNVLYSLHKEMDKEKFNLYIISWPENTKMKKLAADFNGQFYPLKIFYLKHPLRFHKELKKILDDNQYDTVIFNLSYIVSIVPILMSQRSNIKKNIIYSHSSRLEASSIVKRGLLSIIHYMNRYMLKKSSVVRLACSHKAGIWMYGNDASFTIVKNAIELEKFRFNGKKRIELRNSQGIKDNLVLGNVGRLTFPKNQKFLINLFAEVIKQIPDAYLWIIGDGPLLEELKKEADYLNIEKRVVFWGNRNDVGDLLHAMDLFILPSIFEGLPVSAVEAQANGLPCIISDNIDPSVVINSNVLSKDLSDGFSVWVNAIVELLEIGRCDNSVINLTNKGWDIKKATKLLEEIY